MKFIIFLAGYLSNLMGEGKMNKKGISAIVATVLIILITVAAVTIIWAAIIPMIDDQINMNKFEISLNGSIVSSIEYKTVSSLEMIESGKYPDYLFCYSYCIELGGLYNSTDITDNCNMQCVQELGVDEVIYNTYFVSSNKKELTIEWLDKNCKYNQVCATDINGKPHPTDCIEYFECGNYNIEVKGGN